MRISVNLARDQGFRQRHLVAWSVPALLAATILLVRMIVGAETNWRQFSAVRAAADKEAGKQNAMLVEEAALRGKLDEPDNRALLREVQFINYLIDERRLSFGELTDKVTALLPPQARLSGLSMPDASGDPLVHFAIEGTGEEPVETFLTNLENSPDFKDLTITNQGFEEKESGGAPVSITCHARYVGGRSDLALVPAKAKAEPAGEGVLDTPAPEVKAGAKTVTKTVTGLGAADAAAPAAAPLRGGKASSGGPVVAPPTAPSVKRPGANPQARPKGTTGARTAPAAGAAVAQPKSN